MLGLGMVSSSVLYGIFRRRIGAGIKAIVVQAFLVVGAIAGIGAFFLASAAASIDIASRGAIVWGAGSGAAAGLILAGVFLAAWTRASVVVGQRLKEAVPNVAVRPGQRT